MKYHERFQELLKKYHQKSRDCYLLNDYLECAQEPDTPSTLVGGS